MKELVITYVGVDVLFVKKKKNLTIFFFGG